MRWPPLPRRLPRTFAPLRHETYASYLARLAAANTIDVDVIDALAGLDEHDPHCLVRLAALTGQPTQTLLRALPELRHHQDIDTSALASDACPTPQIFINDIRPACRGCVATAGAAAGTVSVWATHDRNVCLRHRLWIGAGVEHPHGQVNLRPHPDIVHAQFGHRRLLRRRGRDATQAAFATAQALWSNLAEQAGHAHQRRVRIARVQHSNQTNEAEAATTHAADYPDLVAFAAILASPYWQAILDSRKPTDNQRFHAELRRRVEPEHDEHANPRLLSWLRRELERSERGGAETDPWPWPTRWQLAAAEQLRHETKREHAARREGRIGTTAAQHEEAHSATPKPLHHMPHDLQDSWSRLSPGDHEAPLVKPEPMPQIDLGQDMQRAAPLLCIWAVPMRIFHPDFAGHGGLR